MRITSAKGDITTLEEWEAKAGPKSGGQWKDGRSAKELAKAWLGEAPALVGSWLGEQPALTGLKLQTAWGEHETRFDAIPGGPRNHDLLVLATSDAGPVVIGVEGKADEAFERAVRQHVDKTLAKNPNSRLGERVNGLFRGFFGAPLAERSDLDGVGYQLFSALAGTLAEAKVHGAGTAVLLVHEMDAGNLDPKKQKANEEQLSQFVEAFGGSLEGPDDRRISSAVPVRGANDRMPETTRFVFAKLRTAA